MSTVEYDEQLRLLHENCDKLIQEYERDIYKDVMEFRVKENNIFVANLAGIWGQAFVAYEAMYLMTIELGKKHINIAGTKKGNNINYGNKFFAIMNIHGRACQIFMEILCLLKGGFVDGALARWRSLFELSIYAMFINKNNDEVASAYMKQANTGEKNAKWAKLADCFKNHKGNITFKLLFENRDYPDEAKDIWQKQYELASKIVHTSPQGTMKRIGVVEPIGAMVAGGTNWGLHVPAEHAVISFHHISEEFFS